MGDFKLTYFNVGGRAELTRLIFAKSGTGFEDERLEFSEWPARKASMPMAQLPVLRYKNHELIQSLTIARFAARKCGLVGKEEIDEFLCDQFVSTLWLDIANKLVEIFFEKDPAAKAEKIEARRGPTTDGLNRLANLVKGNFVLGDELSYADLALVDAEPWLERTIPDIKFPEKLKAVVTKVEADPKIAAYLSSRPKTNF